MRNKAEDNIVRYFHKLRQILEDEKYVEYLHGRIELQIQAGFSLHSGEMLIKFGVGRYSMEVSADNFEDALNEWIRRQAFEHGHNPLCLPRASDPDEVL